MNLKESEYHLLVGEGTNAKDKLINNNKRMTMTLHLIIIIIIISSHFFILTNYTLLSCDPLFSCIIQN